MSRHLRHAAGALCALVIVVACASAFADDGEEAPVTKLAAQGTDRPGDQESDNQQLGYLLLGSSVMLGLTLAGGYYYLRRRQRRQAHTSLAMPISRESIHAGSRNYAARSMWRPVESSSDKSVMLSEVVSEDKGAGGFLPHAHHSSQNAARERVERLDQMACTGCGRRYARHVEFCYFDGLPLSRDTRRKRSKAPSFKACDSCGWEGDVEALICPRDGAEVIEIAPTETTPIKPAIPMTVCPKCRHYGAPGQAFCPDDGEVLMPMLSVRLAKSPERGFGPRRKVCNECGGEFSGHARFCSQDGSKLVALN